LGRDDPDRHRTPEGPISTDRATLDGTLLDRVLPTPSERSAALAVDLALVAGGVTLVTLASQISIPWHPVPLTGGTFGALLIGGLYGLRGATLTLVAYLGIGAAGLGVFAGGSGGWDYVTGSTGGYLVGYLVCAALVGAFADRGASRNLMTMVGVMVVGNAAIYAFGASWLARWTPPGADQALGWRSAYELGVEPFVPGDVVKLFFAACLLPGGWALLRVLDRTTGRS
jgi:biotin transport system substrate-specific component